MRRLSLLVVGLVVLGLIVGGRAVLTAGAQDATPALGEGDCPVTTPEENADLVRRFVDEVYNAHNPALAAEFLAEDFNRSNPARPHQNEPGTADDLARVQRSIDEFPDFAATIVNLVAEDDLVVAQVRIEGTNAGALAGLGAPATDRRAEWDAVFIWRIACGKLAENWVVTDRLTEYRQLGIITDDELATVGTPTVATPVP